MFCYRKQDWTEWGRYPLDTVFYNEGSLERMGRYLDTFGYMEPPGKVKTHVNRTHRSTFARAAPLATTKKAPAPRSDRDGQAAGDGSWVQ